MRVKGVKKEDKKLLKDSFSGLFSRETALISMYRSHALQNQKNKFLHTIFHYISTLFIMHKMYVMKEMKELLSEEGGREEEGSRMSCDAGRVRDETRERRGGRTK